MYSHIKHLTAKKFHLGVLGLNVHYPLTNKKEVPKAFIMIYAGVLVIDGVIWLKTVLQCRAYGTNTDVELLCNGCTTSKYLLLLSTKIPAGEIYFLQAQSNFSKTYF